MKLDGAGASGVGSSCGCGWRPGFRWGGVDGSSKPGSSMPKTVPARKEQQLQIKIALTMMAMGKKRGPCRPGNQGT